MAITAPTSWIEVRGDTDPYKRDLRGLSSTTSTLGSSHGRTFGSRFSSGMKTALRSLGRVLMLGLGAALAGAGILIGKTFRDLGRIEEINKQTEARLKSTGGVANVTAKEVKGLADQLERMSTVEAESIQEGQNLLLTFRNIRNEVGKGNDVFDRATETALNMSVAFKQDMSASAIQLGKALGDPIRGVTALRRVGVDFTEQQTEQIAVLVESGDLLKAQKLILGELEKQVGGAAKAYGEGFNANVRRLGNDLGNVAETILKRFMPALKDMTKRATEFVQSAEFQKWARDAGKWLGENVPKAIDVAVDAFQFITRNARKFANVVGGVLAVALGVKLINAFNAVKFAMMTNPFGAIAVAVVTVAALIITNWDKIKEFLGGVWGWIKRTSSNIWNGLKTATGNVLQFVTNQFANFVEFWFGIADKIIGGAEFAFGWIPGVRDKIKDAREGFRNFTEGVVGDLRKQSEEFGRWGEKSRRETNFTRDSVQFLNREFGKVPEKERTRFETPGLSAANSQVREMLQNLGLMPDEVNIRANIGGFGGGAVGPMGAASGTNYGRMFGAARAFGLGVSSTYRPGDDGHHGEPGPHGAVDISGGASNMLAAARYLVKNFGSAMREIIHTPLGFGVKNGVRVPLAFWGSTVNAMHYNHVHGADQGGEFMVRNRSNRVGLVGIGPGVQERVTFHGAEKIGSGPGTFDPRALERAIAKGVAQVVATTRRMELALELDGRTVSRQVTVHQQRNRLLLQGRTA